MLFYFDIQDDFYSAVDDQGISLPSIEAAWSEAIATATSVARDLFSANGQKVTITVRNETRRLFEVTIRCERRDFD